VDMEEILLWMSVLPAEGVEVLDPMDFMVDL
jgi:hypothetical protein